MMLRLCCCWALAAAAAAAGEIRGTIVFEGEAPEMRPLNISADPQCHAMHGDNPPRNEALVLGEGQTMANVIVRVAEGLAAAEHPVPEEPAVLTQEGCRYAPHVFVVRKGQTLRVLNPDRILHNVNGQPRANRAFNIAMPREMEVTELRFDQVEETPFDIRCDIHPWMRAYAMVLDHPYYDVTDASGEFRIGGLPPGEYVIEAWHERLGAQRATVTVAEGEEAAAVQDFRFSRP